MKKKLKIILTLAVLIVGGGLYQGVLAKEPPAPKAKIHGDVYVLPKDFLVNLEDGAFAKVGVALVVKPGTAVPAKGGSGHTGGGVKPPEGYGPMLQEAAVRAIVTDTLTAVSKNDLIEGRGRDELLERIQRRIGRLTDVAIEDVLFTDVSVQ